MVVGRFLELMSDKEPTFEFYSFQTREWAELCAKYMRTLSPTVKSTYDDSIALSASTDGGLYVTREQVTLQSLFRDAYQEVVQEARDAFRVLMWGTRGK